MACESTVSCLMFDSELVKTSIITSVSSSLNEMSMMLKRMTACNCAVSKAAMSACDMLMSFCSLWLNISPLSSSDNIPFAEIMRLLELMLKTVKKARENAEVVHPDMYNIDCVV